MTDHNPNHAELTQAINLCAEAYHRVKAELPPDSIPYYVQENQFKASIAYSTQLPILCDLASMQIYIACIAHGASIGAIDLIDVGRFCHVAQTAMSAWKLANLTVPAAQKKEQQTHPLPSKGNHLEAEEPLEATPQPSTRQKTPSEAQENTHPHPSKGNHLKNEESPKPAAQPPDRNTQAEQDQSLEEPYVPGEGVRRLRQAAWVQVQALKAAGYDFDGKRLVKRQPGSEPAQETPQGPPKTA